MLSQRIVLLVFQLGYRVASLLLILQYSTLYFAISNLYLCMHHRVRITKIMPATLQCGLKNTFCVFNFFCHIKSISMFALRAHQAGTVKSYQQTSSTSRLISTSKVSSAPADPFCICIFERIYQFIII